MQRHSKKERGGKGEIAQTVMCLHTHENPSVIPRTCTNTSVKGEMPQQFRAPYILSEDWGSCPSNHMEASNHLQL